MNVNYISKIKTKALLFLFSVTMTSANFAQCSIENITTESASGGTFTIGQSFTAECDGELTNFKFYAAETGTISSGSFNIYDGNTNSGTPIYTQAHPDIVISGIGDPINFDISEIVPLAIGNQYTFEFTTAYSFYYSYATDTYPDGETWLDGTGALTGYDLSFTATISPETVTVGVKRFENDKISIFPNPTSDAVILSGLKSETTYTIYDMLGTEILKGTTTANKKINIQNFSNGLYVLEFENGNTLKFVKK